MGGDRIAGESHSLKLYFRETDVAKDMQWKFNFRFLLVGLLLVGCTTPRVVVRSEPPGADVWVQDRISGTKNALGNTPLEVSSTMIDWILGPTNTADFWEILVSKEGFQTAQYYLPRTLGKTIVGFTVKLVPGVDDQRARAVVERLFAAQKFAVKGDFEKAHREVDGVLLTWPRFPRALAMRGSVFLLQRKYHDALEAFENALEVDGDLEEARRMTQELHRFIGRAGEISSRPLVTPSRASRSIAPVPVVQVSPAAVTPPVSAPVVVAPIIPPPMPTVQVGATLPVSQPPALAIAVPKPVAAVPVSQPTPIAKKESADDLFREITGEKPASGAPVPDRTSLFGIPEGPLGQPAPQGKRLPASEMPGGFGVKP